MYFAQNHLIHTDRSSTSVFFSGLHIVSGIGTVQKLSIEWKYGSESIKVHAYWYMA